MRTCDDWFVFHIEPDGKNRTVYLPDLDDMELLNNLEQLEEGTLYKTINDHYFLKFVSGAMHKDVFEEDSVRAMWYALDRIDDDLREIIRNKYLRGK